MNWLPASINLRESAYLQPPDLQSCIRTPESSLTLGRPPGIAYSDRCCPIDLHGHATSVKPEKYVSSYTTYRRGLLPLTGRPESPWSCHSSDEEVGGVGGGEERGVTSLRVMFEPRLQKQTNATRASQAPTAHLGFVLINATFDQGDEIDHGGFLLLCELGRVSFHRAGSTAEDGNPPHCPFAPPLLDLRARCQWDFVHISLGWILSERKFSLNKWMNHDFR